MEIVLQNIKYQNIIKDINIKINSGITGIIGSNGSGKSILLKLIANEILPQSGTIKLNKEYGYIDCVNFKIKNITVYNYLRNILVNKEYRLDELDKRINDVLIMVGLVDYQNYNINRLSKSEILRLSLASLLIYNPKVLIIDEPFIFLDDNNLKKIIHIFRLLKNRYKKTIIIATNKIDTLHKIVDNVYVLHNGKIVMQGDKYEVFTQVKQLKKYNLLSPNVIDFSNTVLEKKNIKIGYRDEINDLLKDIYRYIK